MKYDIPYESLLRNITYLPFKINHMNDFLFILVAGAGKAHLVALLLKIKTNEEDMVNILKSAHAGFKPLQRLAGQTKSKVDDVLINVIIEAIEEVAAIKGVEL